MKAIYKDGDGQEKVVDVYPVNDNFEIVEDSDIYMNEDGVHTYHYDSLVFIDW